MKNITRLRLTAAYCAVLCCAVLCCDVLCSVCHPLPSQSLSLSHLPTRRPGSLHGDTIELDPFPPSTAHSIPFVLSDPSILELELGLELNPEFSMRRVQVRIGRDHRMGPWGSTVYRTGRCNLRSNLR
jgi:hypothetical protein